MDDILDDFRKTPTFTDKDIFIKIWTKPKQVLSYIHENKYDKYVIPLLILIGISGAFDRATSQGLGDNMSLPYVIALCLLVGGILGYISNYIFAGLISWSGKWLNGNADTNSILRVIAYASIPSIIALVFLIPQIVIYGNEMFKTFGDIYSADPILNIIAYGSILIEFLLSILSLVFSVIGVATVQKFGYGKALLNILLPIIVFGVPLLLLAFMFNMI